MEVFDLRGFVIQEIKIAPNDLSTNVTFRRGCYFARLGNEVAKFVVTE